MGERLVGLDDEDVVGGQALGDQTGGGLGGVQSVQGQDHPGHIESGQQRARGRSFAAFALDLAPAQDQAAFVTDGADQEDAAVQAGPGAAGGFAIQSGSRQQPGWGGVSDLPGGGAALLTLGRAGCIRDMRDRHPLGEDIADIAADGRIQRVASTPARTRRKVRSLGSTNRPVSGCRPAPRRWSFS